MGLLERLFGTKPSLHNRPFVLTRICRDVFMRVPLAFAFLVSCNDWDGLTNAFGEDAGASASDGASAKDAAVPNGPFNLVFVTAASYTPGVDFKGLDDADRLCNDAAHQAGKSGRFVAWLSTSTGDARDRLKIAGGATARGWVGADGLPFVDRIDDLLDGKILYPIHIDEIGRPTDDVDVATGTSDRGVSVGTFTATDWTSSAGAYTAGISGGGTELWTAANHRSGAAHLYCFQVDFDAPVTVPKTDGKLAFISSRTFTPSSGIAAADALCNADASGLAGYGSLKRSSR